MAECGARLAGVPAQSGPWPEEATANAETVLTVRGTRFARHDRDATAPAVVAEIDLSVADARTNVCDPADAIDRGCRRSAAGVRRQELWETVVVSATAIAMWLR